MARLQDKNGPFTKNAADITTLTNNTGGTASDTLAAIAAGASYTQADMQAVRNAIASLTAKVNALLNERNSNT